MYVYDIISRVVLEQDEDLVIELNRRAEEGWRVKGTWTATILEEGETKKDDADVDYVYVLLERDSGVINMGKVNAEKVG